MHGYDQNLADRICELVAGEDNLVQQKMFGGLAFLIMGHMAVAASCLRAPAAAKEQVSPTLVRSLVGTRCGPGR